MFSKDKDNQCPLLKDTCIENRCAWWQKIYGKSPDGRQQEEFACAMTWLPVLLIENARESRGTQAAVESFRNEMKVDNEQMLKITNKKH